MLMHAIVLMADYYHLHRYPDCRVSGKLHHPEGPHRQVAWSKYHLVGHRALSSRRNENLLGLDHASGTARCL
jgi:hypothetical protein